MRNFVVLGLMTVPRMGALLEARLEQVDWKKRTIDYGEGHGSKRRPIVPLNDDALGAQKLAEQISTRGYVIEHNGKPLTTTKGVGGCLPTRRIEGVTPHILRHTGATWLVEAGVPDEQIARMWGDTADMVRRMYEHHSPDYLKRAAGALQMTKKPRGNALQVKGANATSSYSALACPTMSS